MGRPVLFLNRRTIYHKAVTNLGMISSYFIFPVNVTSFSFEPHFMLRGHLPYWYHSPGPRHVIYLHSEKLFRFLRSRSAHIKVLITDWIQNSIHRQAKRVTLAIKGVEEEGVGFCDVNLSSFSGW